MNNFKKTLALALATGTLLATYGCGGGGGGGGSSGGSASTTVSGSSIGIFTDSAIQGVSYTTSSGVTGTTDANGSYRYNPGDTVTFKLGSVTLGTSTATGIISPVDLAAGDAIKYRNLLVLVQSLDADGNPGNGITITTAAAAALPSGLDLTQALEATFATSITPAVTVSGSGGVVTSTNANAHFLAQALPLLSKFVVTFMPADNGQGHFGLLRISSTGEYLEGEVGPTNANFTPGVEYAGVNVDIADEYGFHLQSTAYTGIGSSGPIANQVDTNLSAGINNNGNLCQRLRPVGDSFISINASASVPPCGFTAANNVAGLKKAANVPMGIVGVWANGSATTIRTETFVFTADGHFLTVDPIHPGVESGTYSLNTANMTLNILSVEHDTNGAAGLSVSSAIPAPRSIALSADGQTVVVNGTMTLYRVSN